MMRHVIKIAIIVSLTCAHAFAQSNNIDERLLTLGKSLDKARSDIANSDTQSLQELSAAALVLENLIAEARAIERDLNHERQTAEQAFFAESQNLTEIFSLLVVMENAPAPDFLLHPDGALAAARADLILEATLAEVRLSLTDVAARLANWRELQALDVMLQDTANAGLSELNSARAELVASKRSVETKRIVSDPMALDSLYAVSDHLDGFVSGLTRLKISSLEGEYDFDAQRGDIPYPVSGGPSDKGAGVNIVTNDQFVKSPFPATVRFAAEFLDFGKMVILEPSRNVLVIVAGMEQITVVEGEYVTDDDIIGVFGTESADSGEIDLENQSNELYLETRINASPIDSKTIFRLRRDDENE